MSILKRFFCTAYAFPSRTNSILFINVRYKFGVTWLFDIQIKLVTILWLFRPPASSCYLLWVYTTFKNVKPKQQQPLFNGCKQNIPLITLQICSQIYVLHTLSHQYPDDDFIWYFYRCMSMWEYTKVFFIQNKIIFP